MEALTTLADALYRSLATCPVGPDLPAGVERSDRLRAIRQSLAGDGHLDMTGDPALFQVLAQFVCGYLDIDLRDATGLGHGLLIARHSSPQTQQRWISRLLAGELAGIAVTEPTADPGRRKPALAQSLDRMERGGVSGRKIWISRLTEAAVFVLFFRTRGARLAAAAVDATEPGLRRRPIPPTGLAGWTWGILDLDAVQVRPEDVLNGGGMVLLREHFARYRPLVTATALGGAAAVFDTVTARRSARRATGEPSRLRDSALITLGRTHAQLATALLGTAVASHLAEAGDADAELWGAATKAHGVDIANAAAAELALLLGASGFRADCQTAKTRRDLSGLLYADGIHDSLYRTAGKYHTAWENIDDTWEYYPPELLHEWKELQLAEHREQPTRAWPLSDEEAREVAEVSFTPHELGVAHAAASAVVNLARAVGQLIETARHEREAAQRAATSWQGLRRDVNSRMPIYSADTGERLIVEPSYYETVPYRQALQEALQNAVNVLRPLAIAVIAELHAISAVEQRLVPWCQWVERSAGDVVAAASRWPDAGHVDDDEVLVKAIAELQRASAALSAAWRREDAEAPPVPPVVEEGAETESQRLAREHRELLDSARPWSRVDTRPFDAELYQRLQATAPYAATLPETVSFLSWSLSTTAGLAAAVARNADDVTFARLIDEAADQQPLAVAAHLLRELMFIARKAERAELADAAADRVSQRLQSQSWQEPQLWADNELHMTYLLGWAAHLSRNEKVGELIATALAADPSLLPHILRGIAHWSEQRDINTMQFMGIDCGLRELPEWLPVDQVVAEIRRQIPDLQPARYEGVQTETDVVRHLASQLLRLAAGGE